MTYPKVSIILNRNGLKDTMECLESVLKKITYAKNLNPSPIKQISNIDYGRLKGEFLRKIGAAPLGQQGKPFEVSNEIREYALPGVKTCDLKVIPDEQGFFSEALRSDWKELQGRNN
jgi:hypothetical protein